MYYRIESHAKTPTGQALYLSLNNNNPSSGLVVVAQATNDSQLWQPVVLVENSTTVVGTVLLCKQLVNGQQVVAGTGDASFVIPVNVQDATASNATWNLKLPAVQFAYNTDWNLNVSGNGPYNPGNPVLIWKWKDGQPNETWSLVAADF